ncbi:MAG: SCO family protein [Gammaproteobacteria bacterium]|nr:SCO family protein [Gammaproteobacteria bacterium]
MQNTHQKSHKKLVTLILLLLAGLAAIVIYFGVLQPHKSVNVAQIDGLVLPMPKDISDFKLTDNAGQAFTKDSLKGRWTLMFFGFTNCGMVCPTTMSALNKMYATLATDLPREKMPQVVMVSVDPDRDSVQRMNEYVTSFNPHFIGARAELSQIETLEKELHLVAVKMDVEGQAKDHYTINHSTEILVFNPNGQLQAYMSSPHQPEQMVKDFQAMLMTSTS